MLTPAVSRDPKDLTSQLSKLGSWNRGKEKLLSHEAVKAGKISAMIDFDSVHDVLPPHERLVYRGP